MRSINPPIPEGRIRERIRDGEVVWQLQCRACGGWGDIDGDQLHGRVSVLHQDIELCQHCCDFHETRDWSTTANMEEP